MVPFNCKPFLEGSLDDCLDITKNQLQGGVISRVELCSMDRPSDSEIEAMGIR